MSARVSKTIYLDVWIPSSRFGHIGGLTDSKLCLEMSCESFICTLQVSILASRASPRTATAYWGNRVFERHFYDFDDLFTRDVGHTHVVQTIRIIDVVIVEPRAVARLPRCGADHAELSGATTVGWLVMLMAQR
jgi:hypothetical protein